MKTLVKEETKIEKREEVMEMDKKYCLTNETKYSDYFFVTLRRIKALKTFICQGVEIKEGTLGGWIENEDNLSHEGNCWVFDNAQVYSNAIICDNAMVCDSAQIYGNVKVYDNAKIYGKAKVDASYTMTIGNKEYNTAEIYGNAKIYENAKIALSKIYDNAEIYGNVELNVCEVYKFAKCYIKESICNKKIVNEFDQYEHNITIEELIKLFNNKEEAIYYVDKNGYIVTISFHHTTLCNLNERKIILNKYEELACHINNIDEKITINHILKCCKLSDFDDFTFIHGNDKENVYMDHQTTYYYQSQQKYFNIDDKNTEYYFVTHGDGEFYDTILKIDSSVPDKFRYILGNTEYYEGTNDVMHHTHWKVYSTLRELFEDKDNELNNIVKPVCWIDVPKNNFYIRNNYGEIVYECNTQEEIDNFINDYFTIIKNND